MDSVTADQNNNGHVPAAGGGVVLRRSPSEASGEDATRDPARRRRWLGSLDISTSGGTAGSTSSRGSRPAANAAAVQRFDDSARRVLANFSSVSYQPNHNQVYIDWLAQQPAKSKWARWILVILIGFAIGVLAFLLKNCLQLLDRLKWTQAKELAASEASLGPAVGWVMGFSLLYILIGSSLIVFVHPPAAGSGVPETIAFLNGVVVHGTLSLKALAVKFLGNVFAVSSGLPCAIQGPLIAMGAIVGSGIGQFRSKTLGFQPSAFEQFRNAEERRSFTTAGIAAGVAAGFNAPIGGLLYAMEDLSSFWSRRLCWQTFFCSGVAAATANMFNTAFRGFVYQGDFGLLAKPFHVPVQVSVVSLAPAVVLGLVGGLLGALFTRLNVFWCAQRKRVLAAIKTPLRVKVARVGETVALTVVMACVVLFLPLGFPCVERPAAHNYTQRLDDCYLKTDYKRDPYICNTTGVADDMVVYDQVATLLQGSGLAFLDKLTARGTHGWLSAGALLAVLPCWFFMTCITCGSAISGGIFVPTLISGALYGRALGLGLVELWRLTGYDPVTDPIDVPATDPAWAWMDPGVMAVIGAASLLGGVTRLTLAVTVIVVEMEQDIDLTIPVLLSIFVAKVTADVLAMPLWKYQLHAKALPYLEAEPSVAVNGVLVDLELFPACDVMRKPVCTLHATESVAHLAALLLQNDHGAYPVVKYDEVSRTELMYGIISRIELYTILCDSAVYNEERIGAIVKPDIMFDDISVDYIADQSAALERVKMYAKFPIYRSIFINLEPFINQSAPKVDLHYSLARTYSMFRNMGLRHLTVIDTNNRVAGIITRKDLMPFNIEERLLERLVDELDEQDGGGEDNRAYQSDSSSVDTKIELRQFPNVQPLPKEFNTEL